ncbi:MAG: hypothetical protein BWY15_02231 [Firmicutes bacterium ADurb.Bin193]|nr:MAG: hypothetical protein BWY15_02231 [Firmicutes bacterium ADurb.Bin193]
MGAFKKADFYYGAFLSLLIYKGLCPALIEKEKESNRRRFQITTNTDSYEFYCKYMSNPTGSTNPTWAFSFTDKERRELTKLLQTNKKVIFALICTQKKLTSSLQELALIEKQDFLKCVDFNTYKESTPRISVKVVKNSDKLRIWGNKRPDKIGKDDNTIKIERNKINIL